MKRRTTTNDERSISTKLFNRVLAPGVISTSPGGRPLLFLLPILALAVFLNVGCAPEQSMTDSPEPGPVIPSGQTARSMENGLRIPRDRGPVPNTLSEEVKALKRDAHEAMKAGNFGLAKKLWARYLENNRRLQVGNNIVYSMKTCRQEDDERCEVAVALDIDETSQATYRTTTADDCDTTFECTDPEDQECIEVYEDPYPVANSTGWGRIVARPYSLDGNFNITETCGFYISVKDSDSETYVPDYGTTTQQADFTTTYWSTEYASARGWWSAPQCTRTEGQTPETLRTKAGTPLPEIVLYQCPPKGTSATPECGMTDGCGHIRFDAYLGAFKQGDYQIEFFCDGKYGRLELTIWDTGCEFDTSTEPFDETYADPELDGFYNTNDEIANPAFWGSMCTRLPILWGRSASSATRALRTTTADGGAPFGISFTGGDCSDDPDINPAMVFVDEESAYCEEDLDPSGATPTPGSDDGLKEPSARTSRTSFLVGEGVNDDTGKAATGGFDLNGDGLNDLAFGAPGFDRRLEADSEAALADAGAVYIVAGGRERFGGGRMLDKLNLGHQVDDRPYFVENDVEYRALWKLKGVNEGARAGSALAASHFPADAALGTPAFDLLAIGQEDHSGTGARPGSVFLLFSGQEGTKPSFGEYDLDVCTLRKAGFKVAELRTGETSGAFGEVLAAGTDLNGDGLPELAVAAPEEMDDMGVVYLVDGATLAAIYQGSSTSCEPGTDVSLSADNNAILFNETTDDWGVVFGTDIQLIPNFAVDENNIPLPALAVLASWAPGSDTTPRGAVLVWTGFYDNRALSGIDPTRPDYRIEGPHANSFMTASPAHYPHYLLDK